MMKAIAASKKKNDKVDAAMLADLLRCDLVPECVMAAAEIRELRRVLRYRRLAVEQMVKMKNKTAGLLMEVGAEYNKKRLHGKKILRRADGATGRRGARLGPGSDGAEPSGDAPVRDTSRRLRAGLCAHPLLAERVARLMTIPAVGEVTALTWALEIGDPARFGSTARAISYCGLCSAQRESAGKQHRGPLSKQRNRHLQSVLVEAAKLAPRLSPELAQVHARELTRGGRNRATLAVARRLVGWLLAVDKARHAVSDVLPSNRGDVDRSSGLSRSELTNGKGCLPRRAARRRARYCRTVLAVQGALHRAQKRRALDGCEPFCKARRRDGRLRRKTTTTDWFGENNNALPATKRPVLAAKGTTPGSASCCCAMASVSRPAALLPLNLRGRL